MNNRFYLRLAAQNLRKNGRFYLPYLLTIIGTVASFYMLSAAADPSNIQDLTVFDSVIQIMVLGVIVIALVSGFFLLYTNSFLMKQRGREFGLYSILGMSKGNITHTLFWETVYTAILGIGGGLVTGILFNRLMMMLLGRITGMERSIPAVYSSAAVQTAAVFAVFLLLIFLINSGRIHLSQPVALLRGKNEGEREPRARWLLALLGLVTLGAGYYIAISTESPLMAIIYFFVAVLLVIAGTFLLFLTGSTAVLKLLRGRKRYYYKTRHFIAVSGLLYRMKRNAAGLAVICILSTAVLVMISSTVSLYTGMEDLLDASYPRQVMTYIASGDSEQWQPDPGAVLDYAREQGFHPENVQTYTILGTSGLLTENGFTADQSIEATNWDIGNSAEQLFIISAEEYAAATGETVQLRPGETLIRSSDGFTGEIDVFGHNLAITGQMEENSLTRLIDHSAVVAKSTVLVVPAEDFTALYELQKTAYGENASEPEVHINFDLPEGEDTVACRRTIYEGCFEAENRLVPEGLAFTTRFSDRSSSEQDYRSLFGGLLYLGMFLSVLFLAGTVLIIYYKQISEGYEDQDRFEIMQKVGMSRREIAGSIRSQMLLVFFLPLVTAVLHMAAACPMIVRLMTAFSFTNTTLFFICVGISIAVFALIYTLVYTITAKTYYGIVSREGA